MLEAGVLTIGIVYMVATLLADVTFSLLNPRHPLRAARMSVGAVPVESAGAVSAGRARAFVASVVGQLLHSKLFLVGAAILLFWIICAIFGPAIAPHSPYAQNLEGINQAPSSAHLFGTDQLGPGHVLPRDRRCRATSSSSRRSRRCWAPCWERPSGC